MKMTLYPYIHLLETAKKFLKKKATISELRAAVRKCEKAATSNASDCGHGKY